MKEYLILDQCDELTNLLQEPNYPFKKEVYSVYKITNKTNGMIYVGVHYSSREKDGYMGSGSNIREAIKNEGRHNFIIKVLFEYDNERDMFNKETEIVNEEFIARTDTYNIVLGGGGFNNLGLVNVKDEDGNVSLVSVNDPLYTSGQLKFINDGMIPAKDKNGNTYHISINDSRFISGELTGITKGHTCAKDENGNIEYIETTDSRYLSGKLVHMNKNNIVAKDKMGNAVIATKGDKRIENGDLVGITKGTIPVKDKEGNCFRVPKNDPRFLSGELKHVIKGYKYPKEVFDSRRGKGNFNFGTCWIANYETNEKKKIKKEELEEYIAKGWFKGNKREYNKFKKQNKI